MQSFNAASSHLVYNIQVDILSYDLPYRCFRHSHEWVDVACVTFGTEDAISVGSSLSETVTLIYASNIPCKDDCIGISGVCLFTWINAILDMQEDKKLVSICTVIFGYLI